MIISAFDRVENIVGNGEIACSSNFSFSHNVSKGFFPRPVKRCHCVELGLNERYPDLFKLEDVADNKPVEPHPGGLVVSVSDS